MMTSQPRPASESIEVRPARESDRSFILGLATRFADFELPPGRTRPEIAAGSTRSLDEALRGARPGAALLLACSGENTPLGFVYAYESVDFFTGAPYGHVSEIAVAPEAQGTGAAEALMAAAAAWARERGYGRLGLNVFAANGRARRFYERLGYHPETLSYVLPLDGSDREDPS